ncbi:hypothetical protein [Mesorhizobium sp. M0058]|uniref:hypothetical protein n=1 Tax=Mesorhizobium sp. M0058 TaxID=2956865 RepID=UPI00333C489C
MNHFAGFTTPVVGGHHAMLRFAEDGKAEPVMAAGGKPMVFASELEAQKAVTDHLLRYINGRLRRDGEIITSTRDAAEHIFRKGRMIPVERRAT